MFISFEGIEGSGKTTQIALAAKRIQDHLGREVITTIEPGGTALGRAIRSLLLHNQNIGIIPKSELLLFMADRAQHCEEVIKKALRANKIVLCDRFSDATMAYQGYARGMDLHFLKQLNTWATQGLVPDLTLLLDLEPEEGLMRAASRKTERDRLEKEEILFHQRVRDGYLALSTKEPHRFRIINAAASRETVHNDIWNAMIEAGLGT